jgi:hypothetical protein
VHLAADSEHSKQFEWQFLQMLSLLSPHFPGGQLGMQLETLKKFGVVHFVHLESLPEHQVQGNLQVLHSRSPSLGKVPSGQMVKQVSKLR